MLLLIRKDRPNQVINEVISFKKNSFGFYDVMVDMQYKGLETIILHVKQKLPYPLEKYLKLSDYKQSIWMDEI